MRQTTKSNLQRHGALFRIKLGALRDSCGPDFNSWSNPTASLVELASKAPSSPKAPATPSTSALARPSRRVHAHAERKQIDGHSGRHALEANGAVVALAAGQTQVSFSLVDGGQYHDDLDTSEVQGNWEFVDLCIKLRGGAPLTLATDEQGVSLGDHQGMFGSKNAANSDTYRSRQRA